jgi:hypothetical protein
MAHGNGHGAEGVLSVTAMGGLSVRWQEGKQHGSANDYHHAKTFKNFG